MHSDVTTRSLENNVVATESTAMISGRLDRLPATRYIWTLVILLSLGAFFEIYDIALTASISPGLIRAGIFHAGTKGMFGLTDQATFAAVTFLGLFIGTITFASVSGRYGRRALFTFFLFWYSAANVVMAIQSRAVMIDFFGVIPSIGLCVELVSLHNYISP